MPPKPLAIRLAARTLPEPNSGCHLFTGCLDKYGYGLIRFQGKQRRAHRMAYELAIGPIPDGLTLDHLCRTRSCVNPCHLEPVTRGENVLRGMGWSGRNARKTACPFGHPYNLANTLRKRHGRSRGCRECQRGYLRQYYLQHRVLKTPAKAV